MHTSESNAEVYKVKKEKKKKKYKTKHLKLVWGGAKTKQTKPKKKEQRGGGLRGTKKFKTNCT